MGILILMLDRTKRACGFWICDIRAVKNISNYLKKMTCVYVLIESTSSIFEKKWLRFVKFFQSCVFIKYGKNDVHFKHFLLATGKNGKQGILCQRCCSGNIFNEFVRKV